MRTLIVAAGAMVGLALLVPVAVVTWPHREVSCVRSHLIPRQKVCGPNVYWDNPQGGTVLIGRTVDLLPMPHPRPFNRY